MVNRRGLFQAYNAGRRMARQGLIDMGRLNRALGVAQSTAQLHIAKYGTTLEGCGCPDHNYRHVACKGMLALMLIEAGR